MRVLFITHTNVMDGACRSMFQLVEELRANHGVEPVVVCPPVLTAKPKLSVVDMCKKTGIECHTMPVEWFKWKGNFSLIYKARIFVAWFRWTVYMIYRLRKVRFDLVHSNASVIDAGAYLAMLRGVPHVWHLREFGYEDFRLESVFGKKYEKWIYKSGSYGVAISKAVEDKFRPYFGDRIKLIYNGIAGKDDSLTARHKNDVTVFCIVGRVEPNKNQFEVVKACSLLKRMTDIPFQLWIVGRCQQQYSDQMMSYIKSNGLEEDVLFTGERTDVPQILQKCDIGLTPSTNEAFGRVTVEYMMQNLAVIASNTGANPEIIQDGETGLLYELGDIEQLADKMKLLLENHRMLETIAMKGKQHAYQNFTSVQNSNQIFGLYESLLEKQN